MNIKIHTPKSLKLGSGMAYRKEREQIDKDMSKDDEAPDSITDKILQLQRNIDELKAKLQ
jgi:hypothetical protein